jgi:two-component system cell cycle response regulator
MSRILVIEDNPASLELIVYLLNAYGHTPLIASDGEKGLEVALNEQPDLILCDVQLPKINGFEVCRRIKSEAHLRQVPIIAVTAYAMVGDREKLLTAGFNGYISKPINPEGFMDQLKPFIEISQAGLSKNKSLSPEANVPRSVKSKPRATILVVDNTPINLDLARETLEPFGYQVIRANGVLEALRLARENPPDLILSDVHMPQEDGYDFIKAVKADPQLSLIPFVFISSTLWGEQERQRGLRLGAARFILRPINPQALIDEIESCLRD